MSSYNYTESANANLVCCICRSPFVDPCTARTCLHTFCYDCISQAIAINSQCPIDRTPLRLHDLVPADPVIRNLVDELVVHCPQESFGCPHTCQRHLLPVHLRDACQYVQLPCPNGSCAKLVITKDLKDHRCLETPAVDPGTHGEQPEVALKHSGEEQRKKHDTTLPAPTASVASPSTADLTAENAILRLRLAALENVVHTLRSEMFAVKCALGPWYRPDLQPQMEPDEHSGDLETPSFERQSVEESSQPIAATEDSFPPTVRDHLDIASYFPPAEDEAAPPHQRHRSTSNGGARTLVSPSTVQVSGPNSSVGVSYASVLPHIPTNARYNAAALSTTGQTPGASFSATPTAAISIPPLDPSTPLSDTLATLHASLVTTAGGLGALAAARGVEALRTGEEIRGLRTAMHGLRMQIHDILTSRTHQLSGTPTGSRNPDASEPTYNLASPGWLGYGPRPYGMPATLHPPPPGAPPTNITKL